MNEPAWPRSDKPPKAAQRQLLSYLLFYAVLGMAIRFSDQATIDRLAPIPFASRAAQAFDGQLIAIVESEDDIRLTVTRKNPVRSAFFLDLPSNS